MNNFKMDIYFKLENKINEIYISYGGNEENLSLNKK